MKKEALIKLIRNIAFFVLLIILTYWFIFKDQDMNQLLEVIRSANVGYMLLGVLAMVGFFLMEAINIKSLLKLFGDKISIFAAYKYTLIGFFFSAITPAATGGQPVEIYYMNKDNVSGPHATMALLIQLCGYQISTLGLGIICAIFNFNLLSGGFIWLFLVGILINGIALAVMLICTFSKALTRKLVNLVIKIMKFFRVKNMDAKIESIELAISKYNESSDFIKNHKGEFAKSIFRVFIQICVYYTVPFFVYKSFGLGEYNFLEMFTMQAVLYTTVSGLPIPGAVGISETVFLNIFKPAFGEKLISGAMLLTRFITFYFFVVVSLIVVIINGCKKKKVEAQIDKDIIEIEEKYGIEAS